MKTIFKAASATWLIALALGLATPVGAEPPGEEKARIINPLCSKFQIRSMDRTGDCRVLVRSAPKDGRVMILVAASKTKAVPLFLNRTEERPFGENGTTRNFIYEIDGVVLSEESAQEIQLVKGKCSELLGGYAVMNGKQGESYSLQCEGKFHDGSDFSLNLVGSASLAN